jgi:hypothetical protein
VATKLEAQQWQERRRPSRADPELDQFMVRPILNLWFNSLSTTLLTMFLISNTRYLSFQEAYCNMLVKYQEELARPIKEAAEFFKSVERQLDSITGKQTLLLCSSVETG